MANVIWKSFLLGALFERKTPPHTNTAAKDLTIYEENDGTKIALITRGEKNNGIVGYIDKYNYPTQKNKIIYNDQFGSILFHNYEFTTIKDHLSILQPTNEILFSLLENNATISAFITKLINKIFNKVIFNFNYSAADFKFPREIILLPVLETNAENAIWEENGKYFTLAIDYIKEIMDKAKDRKEEKTIKLYEAEKIKYEAEKIKYEAEYKKEKDKIIWKAFKLGELFGFETSFNTKVGNKDLDIVDTADDTHTLLLINKGGTNNAEEGYIEHNLNYKTCLNGLTMDDQFGNCFYHDKEFIMTGGGHISVVLWKDPKLKIIADKDEEIYYFVSLILRKTFQKTGIYGYMYKITDERPNREIILLPVLETNAENAIWEENGKYCTLAINTVCYLYLQGRVNAQQKKIDTYTYGY